MRKVFTTILIILLLLSMTVALIACVVDPVDPPAPPTPVPPETKPDPPVVPPVDPPPPIDPSIQNWSVNQLLEALGASFEFKESVASFKFKVDDLVVKGADGLLKEYTAVINGNIPSNSDDIEFYIGIKERHSGVSAFGIIVTEGKLYIEVGDLKLHIENVDTGYLINIVKTVAPELLPLLDGLLSGLGMTVADIFNGFIKGWIFNSLPNVRLVDNVYDINFDFDIHNLLMSVLGLAGSLDLDGLLGGLGVVLPGGISINAILSDIKNLIPEFDINISTKLLSKGFDDEGYEMFENLGIGATVKGADAETVLGFTSEFNFYNTKQNIDIPTGLEAYDPFSLTHMQMDFYLGAEIKSLDVGELIEMFVGKPLLPKDTLMVTANAGITLRMQLDLNLKNNAENMLLLELYNGKDATDKSKRLAGIYFIDNKIKINLNELTSIYQGKNIEISMGSTILTGEGGLLTGLLDMLKAAIDKALEGFTPKLDGATNTLTRGGAASYNGGNHIVSLMIDELGKGDTDTGSVLSFINSLIKMVGFDQNIILTNEDGITVKVNTHFFDVIRTFISDEATQKQIDKIADIIGELNLNVAMENFNFLGIDNISIDWIKSPALGVGLKVSNMLFGFKPKELENNINDATSGKDYESSLKNILYSALEGVDLGGRVALKLPAGEFNIMALLSKLGVPTDAIPLDGLLVNIPQGGLTLDLTVSIQMKFDMDNPQNSIAKIEIYNHSRLLIFEEGFLLGVYMANGKIYVNAPGINLYGFTIPKVAIEMDIFSLLKKEIDKIDLNFILSDWLPKTSTMSDGDPSISDIIGIEINDKTFKLAVTSLALSRLLAAFGIVFELPELTLNVEVTEWKAVKLDLGLMLDTDAYATFDMNFTQIQLGGDVTIAMPEDLNDENYLTSMNDIVDGIVDNLLSGLSMDMNLKLTLPGGTFPLGQLLSGFVVGIPDIQLEVGDNELGNDVVLDLQLRLRMKSVADDPSTQFDESRNSTFLLEFILNHEVFGIKPGILIGLYTVDGESYIDLSGFKIGELKLPRLALDINIPKLIADQIHKINIAGMIPGMSALTNMDDALDKKDFPVIELSPTGLSVAITANAIAQFMKIFGLEVTGLPEFDARLEIDAIDGLGIVINNCKLLSLDLGITNVKLGGDASFEMPPINKDDFPKSITYMIKDTITKVMNGTQVRMGVKVDVDPMVIYADDLLALFGIDFDTEESVAVIEIKEKMTLDIEVLLKIDYDAAKPLDGKVMLKFYLKNDFFLQAGANKDGLLLAIYCNASSGKMETYIDLSGLKLGDAPFPKLRLNIDLMDMVLKQIDSIKDLDDQFENVIGGITNMSDDVNNEQPENPTLYIYQNALAFKIASEALMAMLSSFGVNLELPFQFDLTADLKLGSEYPINGLTILINTRNDGQSANSYTFNASLFIGDFIIGRPDIFNESDEMPMADDTSYLTSISDALKDAANNLLNGTTATAEFDITLRKHTYDVGKYLSRFVDTNILPNLILDIQADQKLGLRMELMFKSRGEDGSPKGLSLQFFVTSAPLFFKDYVFDMSKPLISIIGDTNGKTYLDLSNIVLSAHIDKDNVKRGVKLPKICMDIDILKIIDDQMSGLKSLDKMLEDWLKSLDNNNADNAEPTQKVSSTVGEDNSQDDDASALIKRYLVIGITDKRVEIKVTAEAIRTILRVAGLSMELPPIELEGSIDVGDTETLKTNGLYLKAAIYDIDVVTPSDANMLMSLMIKFSNLRIGEGAKVVVKQLTQEEKDSYSPTINAALKDSLKNILSGTHIEADLEIRLPSGKYNIAELLGAFGVDAGIIPLTLPDVTFNNPINLCVRLTFLVEHFDPNNSANNRFIFKLTLVEDVVPYETVDNEGNKTSGALMKAGTDLFRIFTIGDNRTYIDLSGLTFANISLPRFYIDTDVLGLVNKLIESQDIDKLIKDAISGKPSGGNSGNEEEPPTQTVADDSDSSKPIEFPVNVTFTEKNIRLQATSKALMLMLSSLGVNLPIPDVLAFDIVGEFNGLGVYDPNMKLEITVDKIDSIKNIKWIEGKYFAKASFALEDINFDSGATIPTAEFENLQTTAKAIFAEGGDRLKFILFDVLKTLDLEFSARLNIAETKLNLTSLINQLLASSGQRIDIPIDIKTDNLDQTVHFDIKWNLDFRKHINSEAYILLYTDSGLFEVKLIYKSNVLYIDLSRLGLLKFKISNFNLTALIDSILSDMLSVVNTDITNMLMGLLFPNSDSMGDAEDMGDGTVGGNSNYMSRVGQATYAQGAINATAQKADIFEILGKVIGNLSIQDLIAKIGINSDLFAEILQSVGVGLGKPIAADGTLNLPEGALALNISLNGATVDLNIKLVKIGGTKRYIDWAYFTDKFIKRLPNPSTTPEDKLPTQSIPNDLATEFLDFGEYSLISGYDLVMSMFQSVKSTEDPSNGYDSQPAVLTLNTSFMNKAYGGMAYMKLSANRCLDYSTSIGGKYTAKRGAIRLTLFKGHDTASPVVYITLDPAARNINILGTRNLFSVIGIVGGELVNVNIAMDLASTLGGLLDPIFKMIPDGVYNGGIESTPTADGKAAAPAADGALDFNKLLSKITLNVMNSGQIKVVADINGTDLNEMLVNMLENLFWTLDLGDLCGNVGASNIRYRDNLDSGDGFFDSLWERVIKPLVRKNVGDVVANVAGAVKSQIKDVVERLLPLPRFDFMQLSVDLLNGKASNMFLETRRKKTDRTYDVNNLPKFEDGGAWEGESLGIEIYNTQAKSEVEWSKASADVRDWKKQSNNVIYDPYVGGNLASNFNMTARMYNENTSRYDYKSESEIVWSVKPVGNDAFDSIVQPSDANNFNAKFLNDNGFRSTYGILDKKSGAYVYTLRGTAKSFHVPNTGNKVQQHIDVKITILPKGNIVSVKDVVVAEHGVLPDEAIANIDVTLPSGEVIQVSRAIKTAINNAARTKPYEEGESILINSGNVLIGPHVSIDGANYGVNVQYLSSKAVTYGRDITIDAYSKNDFTRTLPDRIYFAYENGAYNSSRVLWDSTQLNLSYDEWIKGTGTTPRQITARLLDEINLHPNGDTRQVLTFDITILNTEVQSVKFDSELSGNILSVNPFDILAAKESGDTSTIFPKTATVTYADAHTDSRKIMFDGSAISIDELYEIVNADGGRYDDKLGVRNADGDISWRLPIILEIERKVPKYVAFGKDANGKDIKTLRINPYAVMLNGIESVMPSKVNVVYEQGDTIFLDVKWDTKNLKITPDGGTFIVPITIAPNTKLSRTLDVQVIVDRLQIQGLAYENNTLVFDYAPEVLYGGRNRNEFLPTSVPIITTNGEKLDVPAVMDFSDVNIDINGNNNAVAKATVGSGAYQQTFQFRVIVPAPKLIDVAADMKNLWIDIADIRSKGSAAYPKTYKFVFAHYNGTTITKELPIHKWDDAQVVTINRVETIIDGKTYDIEEPGVGGMIKATIAADSSGSFMQEIDINMSIGQRIDVFDTKEITLKYTEGQEFKLPDTLPANVTTVKIDKVTSSNTPHTYVRNYPVTWDTTNFNIFNGGTAYATFMKGDKTNEQTFQIKVNVTSAPAAERYVIASNQKITLSYSEFVTSGNQLLPKVMKWNLMSVDQQHVLGTYTLPVQWDTAAIDFAKANVTNGVATFKIKAKFNVGIRVVSGEVDLIINNIPMLNESSKTMKFTHSDYLANQSKLFKPMLEMIVYDGTTPILKTINVKWDLTALKNALEVNNNAGITETTVVSTVEVILNKDTPYEVRYTVKVTVTDVAQTL